MAPSSPKQQPTPGGHPAPNNIIKMGKYLDNLKERGTDKEQQEQYEHDAAQAALQLQSRRLKTQQEVTRVKRALHAAKSASPLDVDRIVELSNELEDFTKGLTIIGELEKELF